MHKIFDEKSLEPNLPGIILISHGQFAIGLLDSMEMIIGKIKNVAAFSLERTDSPEQYGATISVALDKFPKGSIVLVDLLGGTPSNQLMVYMNKKKNKVEALSGANLPMFLEAVTLRDKYKGKELINMIKKSGENGIINIEEFILNLKK